MKEMKIVMGMPVTVEIVESIESERNDRRVSEQQMIAEVFTYFEKVDRTFSTYKTESEISLLNAGKISVADVSEEVKEVLDRSEQTKQETHGFFNIKREGKIDPSGLVKGWAIWKAAQLCKKKGFQDFYIEAGGDIQVSGKNPKGKTWRVGIRNPFQKEQIVKVIELPKLGEMGMMQGIATSGTYERGNHIYNPTSQEADLHEVVSLTVIGPNVYEADRFATAAFAMGRKGIEFIESMKGFEGYQIDRQGQAYMTSGFSFVE